MYLGHIMEYAPADDLYDRHRHPYTRALFSAVPSANPDEQNDPTTLKGEVPSAFDPPPGCKFQGRCPLVEERCRAGVIEMSMEDEEHGVDYFFIAESEFVEMIEKDELFEYARVYNDFKGIPKDQVRQALRSGKDVVMRLDVQGAETIRRICPEAILIFLTVEDEEEMARRLRSRSTESEESLKLRITTARQELKRIDHFDYIVINREAKLDDTVGNAAEADRLLSAMRHAFGGHGEKPPAAR